MNNKSNRMSGLKRLLVAVVMICAPLVLSADIKAEGEVPNTAVEARFLGFRSYPAFTRLVFDTGGVPPQSFRLNYTPEEKRIVLYPDAGLLAFSFAPVSGLDDVVRDVDFTQDDSGQRGIVVHTTQVFSSVKTSYLSEPYRLAIDIYKQGAPLQPPVIIKTIAIDPGHGGRSSGAKSSGQLTEKALALDIAVRLKGSLTKLGYNAVLLRTADSDASPDERAGAANMIKADLYVSVHVGGSFGAGINGVEIYVPDEGALGGPRQLPSTWSIQNAAFLPDEVRLSGVLTSSLTGLYKNPPQTRQLRLAGLPGLKMPAVEVEIGNLNDAGDASRLAEDSFRTRIAISLAKGIDDFAKGASQ